MEKKTISTDAQSSIFVFQKINYQLLLVSILIVVIGFALMSGNTNIYSFRKIVLAPIVVIGGFIFGFYAILKKPKSKTA
jgi:uncharacterized membrane protein YedE/YeeE